MTGSVRLTNEDQQQIDSFCSKENFTKLVLALGFYADPETYRDITFKMDYPCGPFANDFSMIQYVDPNTEVELHTAQVPGEHARNTLAEVFNIDRDVPSLK